MNRLLFVTIAGFLGAGAYWAFQSGYGPAFWLAASVAAAGGAALMALAANMRLSRLRADYTHLSAQFEAAVNRIEKQGSALNARLAAFELGQETSKQGRRKASADLTFIAPKPSAEIITHPKAVGARTSSKPQLIEGGLAAAERMGRQRRAVERGFKKACDTGQFPLCLQPVLAMPDGTPAAYIASARIADHDLPAFEVPGDGIDVSRFTDLMLGQCARASRQLADKGGQDTPLICQIHAAFLFDAARFGRFASAVEAQPQLAAGIIAALPEFTEAEIDLALPLIDRLARAGMRFAVASNANRIAASLARVAARAEYAIAKAVVFSDTAQRGSSAEAKALAESLKAQLIALDADSERLQLAVMEQGIRLVTSAQAAPPRLVKPYQTASRESVAV